METFVVVSAVASISVVAFMLFMKYVARIESLEQWNVAVFFLAIAACGISLSHFVPAGYIVISSVLLAAIAAKVIVQRK